MNVLILVASYPPSLDSAARLYSQLAEHLAGAGHSVTVISQRPAEGGLVDRSHPYFGSRSPGEMLNGVRVVRVSPLESLAKMPGGKALRFLISCLLFAAAGMRLDRQHVVLVYSPPLFMGVAGHLLSRRHGCRMVLNVQDIHPRVLFESGFIRNPLVKAMLAWMERFNYRRAASFIVYSNGNRAYLMSRKVKRDVHVIPNWVDVAAFRPSATGDFRKEVGIGNQLLVSYVGTMSPAQGLAIVIEAAALVRSCPGIMILLAGDGPSKKGIAERVQSLDLQNVLLLPALPPGRYLDCLATSDVILVTLSSDVPPETVPGKLAYAMASGKPVLAAVSPEGDAASIVRNAGAGLCVEPNDAGGLAEAMIALHRDPAGRRRLGESAARYAAEHFSGRSCMGRYERVLVSATGAQAIDAELQDRAHSS